MTTLGTPTGEEEIDATETLSNLSFTYDREPGAPEITLTPEQEQRARELIQEEFLDAGFELTDNSTEIIIQVSADHNETGSVMVAITLDMFGEEQSAALDFDITP